MTSETDYPRQRTVAELLAEHGGGAPTGRRRRRRAAEEAEHEPAESSAVVTDLRPAEPDWPEAPEPDRSVLRDPVPSDPTVGVATSWDTAARNGAASNGVAGNGHAPLPPARPPRVESPTEQIPLISEGLRTREGVGRTGPMERLQRASTKWRDALEVVERGGGEGARTRDRGVAPDERLDGGPPTQASAPLALDELDDDEAGRDPHLDDGQLATDYDAAEYDAAEYDAAEYDDAEYDDEYDDREPEEERDGPDAAEVDLRPRRRLGRAAAESVPAAQTWAFVLAQWVVGALGGAALWVGFRFLWRSLPVVALTAAALVTIGLIVLVRALLRSKDWRTTGLAVLVGLLLTVSPALLVLLDR